MLQKMMKKNEKGFTLIELMIVIAIIGILAAIAVPQFLSYRMRSYNTAALAVLHNLKADEANLNAELGVYGHTEAAAAALNADDAGAAEADTEAVPDLAVAATPLTAGARLVGTKTDTGGRTMAIGTALGARMIANVTDDNDEANNSTFHAFTRHFKGSTAYGLDNDVEDVILVVSNPTDWPDKNGLQATPIDAALPPADDVNGEDGDGAPTKNWTPLN